MMSGWAADENSGRRRGCVTRIVGDCMMVAAEIWWLEVLRDAADMYILRVGNMAFRRAVMLWRSPIAIRELA